MDILNWFGNRPWHFGIAVIGFTACFFMMVSCCREEYSYKLEREKLYQKSFELHRNMDKNQGVKNEN